MAAAPPPRIPLELRSVFLASNRGEEVHEAPKSAFGVFRQGMRIRWSRLIPRPLRRRSKETTRSAPTKTPSSRCESTTAAAATDSPSASRTTRSLNDSSFYSDGSTPSPTRLFLSPHRDHRINRWFSSKKHTNRPIRGTNEDEVASLDTKNGLVDLTESATDDPSETEHTFGEALLAKPFHDDDEEEADDTERMIVKPTVSPQEYLDALIYARGYSTQRFSALQSAYYNRPTPLQQASFQPFLLNCLKMGKAGSDDLCRLLCGGVSPNPSNRFGESLIHKVCRLGRSRLLSDLLHKVPGIDVRYCDEHGRTPLHDACAANSLECWELLCEKDLRLLYVADHLNMVPLQFVPQHAWRDWIVFLDAQKDTYWPEAVFGRGHEEPPPLLTLQSPHGRPLKDPTNALPIDLAEQLANGKLTVERAHDEKERRWAKRPMLGKLIANLDEMYDLDDIDFDSSSSSEDESDITEGSATNEGEHDDHDNDDDDTNDEDDDEDEEEQSAAHYSLNLNGQQEAMNVLLGISARGGAAQAKS